MARLWLRNPTNYMTQAKEVGCFSYAFDAGFLAKKNKDLFKVLTLHHGENAKWDAIVIDDRGSAHYKAETGDEKLGVYPTWNAETDSMDLLEQWCVFNVGDSSRACNDTRVPEEFRPIFGQEHRVIVHNLPSMSHGYGKDFYRKIAEMQDENPDCKIFMHGSYAIGILANLGFLEFDYDARTEAAKGKLILPNGKKVEKREWRQHLRWIQQMGYSLNNLEDAGTRCVFNIKSLYWLFEKPSDAYAMRASDAPADADTPDAEFRPATNGRPFFKNSKGAGTFGDKVDCNTCSLASGCKFYREGSVCTLPGSEMSELAQMFRSRDSQVILEGISNLTAMAAARTERAIDDETDFGIDPEVTKMLNQTFNFAERYAKLNDPFLRASVTFQHLVDHGKAGANPLPGVAQVSQLSASDAAAMAIEHYEKQGIARADITMEMVQSFIASLSAQPAIEGTVVNG